jgi:hypothetical protein
LLLPATVKGSRHRQQPNHQLRWSATPSRRAAPIVDNGDGTFTDTILSTGGSRFYDAHGNLVLKDPGQVRYAYDVNYNGTPGDPRNWVVVDGSFRIVKPSTGNSDLSGLDFCALLVKYTS